MSIPLIPQDKASHFIILQAGMVGVSTVSLLSGCSIQSSLLISLAAGVLVAVSWEGYWFYNRYKRDAPQNTFPEMVMDSVAGLAGGLIAHVPLAAAYWVACFGSVL